MSTQLNLVQPPSSPDPNYLAIHLRHHFDHEAEQNIDNLAQKKVIFSRNGIELQPINGWNNELPTPDIKTTPFTPAQETQTVAGIDSSCIHIAETSEGSVYAGRAAVVFSQNGHLTSYVRIGPIVYYMNEAAASRISYEVSGTNRLTKLFLIDRSLAQRIIREHLERAIALELVATLSASIILLDGCLKTSKFDEQGRDLRRVLDIAGRNGDTVIGLSKTTKVGLLTRLSSVLYNAGNLPAYLDVDHLVAPVINRVEGHVILARFSRDGYVYRVDLPHSADAETSLSHLMYNDHFYHGYPETLRLAHHLSVFTTAQSDSVKSYLMKHAGVVEIPSEDLRRVTLGSLSL